MVEIIKISAVAPDKKEIAKAAAVIKKGGLVIFPTETCYGLAADATNEAAVKKVYNAKRREKAPLSIIVADPKMAAAYCELTPQERAVAKKLMPGPLTLVVKKDHILPVNLTLRPADSRL